MTTNGSSRDMAGHPSPDAAASDGNSSVQVNVDSLSNRGRSVGRRSRSPSARASRSRGPEQPLARQATANSLSSFLSSQPSSQTSQHDQATPEDLLRDLIEVTESSNEAIRGTLQGVKRPYEDETADADEPLAKRDKLGEELERMFASHPARAGNAAPLSSSTFSTSATTAYASTAHASPTTVPGIPIVATATRGALPIRASRRRLPNVGNGTAMSRCGIPEASELPSSADDELEHSSDGQGT